MGNILSNLFSTGATSLVDAVGNAIDKVTTSDEERKAFDIELARAEMGHNEKMAEIAQKDRAAELSDTADARSNQSRIQESSSASWLSKNVHSILSLSIVGLTFFMFWYMLFSSKSVTALSENSAMKDIMIYILGALTTVASQVCSYYFGSSSGSADKTKTLNDIMKRP